MRAIFLLGILLSATAWAQDPIVLKLRDGDTAASTPEVETKDGGISNISVPEMIVHLPDKQKATGAAVLVCPGGGYREVGSVADGMGAVPYFVPKGVAVIVLKYRTHPPSTDVANDALADAKRAMRLVRLHAKEWGIDPQRFGVIGSSAGSNLTLNLATHCDRGDATSKDPIDVESCRPDFIALLCPWPNQKTVADFPIGNDMPPTFIASAKDDKVAPFTFASDLADACKSAGVPTEFWPIEAGGHTAFKQARNPANQWPEHIVAWLKKIGYWKD